MHVGLILEHSDPGRGGAELYAASLAARLREHGHKTSIASRTGPFARPVASRPAALRPWFFARRLLPALRAEGAEVVLALVPVPGCDIYQPRNGILRASIPPHLEPLSRPWRTLRRLNPIRRAHFLVLERFEARTVRPPCRFFASSPLVARDFKQCYPDLGEPVLLRTGVDLERFVPAAERPPGPPRLVFCAHSFALKGLKTVLEALRELDETRLEVVGDGPRARYARYARRLGVEKRITWRGREPDLASRLRQSDLLVHPTFYDTAARVVLEALACGLGVVTTTRDGNADLVAEAGGAVLEDPGSAAGLAQAVRRLLAVDRNQRRDRALAVAEEHPADLWLDRTVEAITCGS